MMADEAEVDATCSCAVCIEVLMDPVTLPCGHALDQACAQRVVNASVAGAASCPTCREPIPAVLPSISVQLRDLVARLYPKQVGLELARTSISVHAERRLQLAAARHSIVRGYGVARVRPLLKRRGGFEGGNSGCHADGGATAGG